MRAKQKNEGNDGFELSAEELAQQEGRPKPRLVRDGKPVKQEPPEEAAEGDLTAQRLPGMELPAPPKLTAKAHAELTYHCQKYDKLKYKRVDLSRQEVEAKKNVDAYLHSYSLDSFVYPGPDGKIMEAFVDRTEVIGTRERKDKPDLTEPAVGTEEEGGAEDE